MSKWNRVYKPIVVLVAICLIVTGTLAATNQATAPIISKAIADAQQKARKELIPEADEFESLKDIKADNVSDISVAKNGAGTVITANGKGYGGKLTVMVAFNSDKTIKQIKVTEQAETQGVGTRVTVKTDFWKQFEGKSASEELKIGENIDKVSGASISSKAVTAAVNSAINAYNMIP